MRTTQSLNSFEAVQIELPIDRIIFCWPFVICIWEILDTIEKQFASLSVGVLEFSKCVIDQIDLMRWEWVDHFTHKLKLWCLFFFINFYHNSILCIDWSWASVFFVRSSSVNETNSCVKRNVRWKNSHQTLCSFANMFEAAIKQQSHTSTLLDRFQVFVSIFHFTCIETKWLIEWADSRKNTTVIERNNSMLKRNNSLKGIIQSSGELAICTNERTNKEVIQKSHRNMKKKNNRKRK